MVHAVVLIEAEPDKLPELAEKLVEIDGITAVFSVAGRYDLVANLRVPDNEAVADIVSSEVRGLDGIVRTETLIAFRVYSRMDIEGIFAP
ncbi:MAG: AsnC family transcriptional regulator [Gemmatimonas sp. SG8_23]|jgi:DNA-binding Lrp family transcriptional regulator|nr:MAG: AsnC family transcriptional regulator [Gemmatimonas sp. SG8_23]